MRRAFLIGLLILGTVPATAPAQLWSRVTGSQLNLSIKHEATVKAPLEHVAFTEPSGKCADALSDALVADFASSGTVVIDRQHLKTIIAEHKLNVSGLVDQKSAAKIGRLIGTGSLVFVKVYECQTSHAQEAEQTLDLSLSAHRQLIPTTRGSLKASVQIINLTTGVTVAARVVNAKASLQSSTRPQSVGSKMMNMVATLQNRDERSKDAYPPDEEAVTALFNDAVNQVHRMLYPWTENRRVHFFEDRECGLNVANNLLRASDYEGAAREANASVESCREKSADKPAVLAHAYYNRGITLFLIQDFDAALADFGQAARLDSNKVITEAMAECNKARAAAVASGGSGRKSSPILSASASRDRSAAPSAAPSGTTVAVSASAPSTSGPKASLTAEERLRRLDDLHKKKMISDDEYERKRKEILADL
jgi:tetratricopeptide (TPR) repeat protein